MINNNLNFTDTINQTHISTINLIPQSDKPGIKELLTELQIAIEAETNLSDDDKAEALEQVKTLAEVGKNPQESTMQKAGKTAMKILKGTIASLPSAATLVEACSKLLFEIETFDESASLQLDEISSKLTTNLNQLPHSPGLFQLVIDQLLKYYQLSIKAVEERYQAELQAKDAQIETYREEIAFLRELTVKLAKNPIVINSSQDNKPE
ncbi:MAG: hypothetical protein JGK04_24515 [Microcoleus sp. PH2017_39_LGB_O_B]|uniref:hypothetical protein n=1 Tax=unclassified Microcoleus TaxID=2642155 RepID=UPI001DF08BDE|nr:MULTISPECIES: hypothetical protein [unclassified Microcoleus]MCC3450769.1 hypothetical protein [Microcoleus sp. PH2017_09_SFU_O_A]MCC3631497.1 hypothetical protein [Microcoleus sp. PH2017_39_LGB_O_B]MCC3643722.1 hypothetical protein [Microcoleus sp. PH2017_33_LGB_O_A]